ncbi:MAG TPA: hypothetical protein DIW47_06065 [Bacteroidetes bacterium]|nr:hypothetical protein [Bacteroidota bacterium]
MTNIFTSPENRPFFSELLRKREAGINSLINNLKIADVKEDEKFVQTATRIKNSVLLQKVEFGDPRFVDHQFEDKPLNIQQQLIGGMSRNHYVHEILFPFTGDTMLFDHAPNEFSRSSSDRGLILPGFNNLRVYVDLPELNPTRAIVEAQGLLSLTMQFVSRNNAAVDSWTTIVSQTIDHLLELKREELIKIFG